MTSREIQFIRIFGTNEYSGNLQLSDAQLYTEDGCRIDVHRFSLARNNEYFRALFYGISTDRKQIVIPGIAGETLSEILRYIYTGQISLTSRNIADVMVAADYLLVTRLYKEVEIHFKDKITTSNSLSLLVDAYMINSPNIYKDVFRFIQTHFDAVARRHDTFAAELPLEVLKQFLCNGSLHISDERSAWFVIVNWVQKDTDARLSYAPLLLKHLAVKEIDENLSKDIMSRRIVEANPYCKVLNNYKNGNIFVANLDILKHYLRIHSNHLIDNLNYRIPSKLHVVAKNGKRDSYCGRDSYCEIYVTYDENLDLWHKVAEVDFHPHCILIQHNLYLFDSYKPAWFNLDLKTNVLSLVSCSHKQRKWHELLERVHLVKLEPFIYVIGLTPHKKSKYTFDMEIFYPEVNEWSACASYINVNDVQAVSNSRNMYIVVSMREFNIIITQMYNPESRTWSLLPPPEVFRMNYACIAYHEELFVIGGSNGAEIVQSVEIYNPKSGKWREVQDLPIFYRWPKGIVLNDRLIVFEEFLYTEWKIANDSEWNESQECWVKRDESDALINPRLYNFYELEDVETIRTIWKDNIHSNIEQQRSDFY